MAALDERTGPRVLAHRQRRHALSQTLHVLVILVVVANAGVAIAFAAGLLPLDSATVEVRPAGETVVQQEPSAPVRLPTPAPLPPAPTPAQPAPLLLPLAPVPVTVAETEPVEEDVPVASTRTVAWVQPSDPATVPPLPQAPAAAPRVQEQPPAVAQGPPPPAPAPEPPVTPTPTPPEPAPTPTPPATDVEIVLTAAAGASEHELTFNVPAAGSYAFVADLLVFVPGQVLSITLDGADEGTWTSETTGPDWVSAELLPPAELEAGAHTLRVSGTSDEGVRLECVTVTDAAP